MHNMRVYSILNRFSPAPSGSSWRKQSITKQQNPENPSRYMFQPFQPSTTSLAQLQLPKIADTKLITSCAGHEHPGGADTQPGWTPKTSTLAALGDSKRSPTTIRNNAKAWDRKSWRQLVWMKFFIFNWDAQFVATKLTQRWIIMT